MLSVQSESKDTARVLECKDQGCPCTPRTQGWGSFLCMGVFPIEDPWRPPEMSKLSLKVDWEWGTVSESPGAPMTGLRAVSQGQLGPSSQSKTTGFLD